MDEIKYLKDTKIEITARKIDNDVYIHQESVLALLKDYKQQLILPVVGVPKGTLCDKHDFRYVCDNESCELMKCKNCNETKQLVCDKCETDFIHKIGVFRVCDNCGNRWVAK